MGRIEKVLKKARSSKTDKTASLREKETPVPITGGIDTATDSIDFAKLANMIPDNDCLETYHVVAALPDAPQKGAYKVLRTRVLQRLKASQWNVIGVSGAGPGEGKSLTAINLAFSLAQDVNHQVILVDLDLRRPSIHTYLGINPKYDLTSFLNKPTEIKNILVRPNEKRLAVLTNRTTHSDSSEILSSPDIANLIHQLKNLGPRTITIIDLPPVLASDDVIAFSPLIDALLLVVGEATCRREDLIETQELLKGSEILGVVLNRSREKTAASGYYGYY